MITNKLLLGFIIVFLNSLILNINGGCCGKGKPNNQSTQTGKTPDPSKGSKRINPDPSKDKGILGTGKEIDPNLGKLKNEIPPKKNMTITVNALYRKFSFETNQDDTIGELKKKIKEAENINGNLKLIFAGKELDNLRTVGDYNIREDSTVYCIIRNI